MPIQFWTVLLIAVLPILELRGAIPYAHAVGLTLPQALVAGIVGNLIPVLFVYPLAKALLHWAERAPSKHLQRLGAWVHRKGERAGKKLVSKSRYGVYFGLFLFVGIPLPGTGVWTGLLAAALLDLGPRRSALACACGVFMAAGLFALGWMGILHLLSV